MDVAEWLERKQEWSAKLALLSLENLEREAEILSGQIQDLLPVMFRTDAMFNSSYGVMAPTRYLRPLQEVLTHWGFESIFLEDNRLRVHYKHVPGLSILQLRGVLMQWDCLVLQALKHIIREMEDGLV